VADLTIRAGAVTSVPALDGPATISVAGDRIRSIEAGVAGAGVDLEAPLVSAGYLDIHTHGTAGHQAIDGQPEDLAGMAREFARHGVTGFLAGVGGSAAHIESGVTGVRDYLLFPVAGARCLGVHLEGPFLSPHRPGAFRPESIVPADPDMLARWQARSGGHIRLLTVAPEIPGAADLIHAAHQLGIICSAGHSDATTTQARTMVDRGVHAVTHLFNAMPALHHREPGLVGIALTDDRVTTEIIADGVHVAPEMVALVHRAKGVHRIALITDSIAAAGLDDGEYQFEEQRVIVRDGQARLADGTLAGSTLTMDRAVRNFASFSGIPVQDALPAATSTPARVLGIDSSTGSVRAGLAADLVGLEPDGTVRWTVVAGVVVFHA
jgi:N-acetylglucosamine-6-phosphate deacetylase